MYNIIVLISIKILGEEGRWERNGCTLTQDGITGVVLCRCPQQGTYAIIRVRQGDTRKHNHYNHYGLAFRNKIKF